MVNLSRLGFFVGEYRHNLTERNRIVLPKRLRAEVDGDELILAKGTGFWIEGFDKAQWKQMVSRFLEVPFTDDEGRNLRQRVFSSAMIVELDSQGRVVLPDPLLSWAGLKGKIGEELVIVGVGDHLEIWERSRFEKENKTVPVKTA
jgi:MraZ protein